ncbi:hypothetical protein VZT92_025448 [Zoarces viviparus]|uniref:Uncharacterized protein n=1 Tax=Zoarces viviparus TaxID=48416 RepID=A0AAW1DY61_ZOAVI
MGGDRRLALGCGFQAGALACPAAPRGTGRDKTGRGGRGGGGGGNLCSLQSHTQKPKIPKLKRLVSTRLGTPIPSTPSLTPCHIPH